jgi:hypothetical protein
MKKQEEAPGTVETNASSAMSRKGEEMSRMCCSMINGLPEAHPNCREMISIVNDIKVCIQNGNPKNETHRLRARFEELIADYRRYCQ